MGKYKLLVWMLALGSVSMACGSEDDPITDAGFPAGSGGSNTGASGGNTGVASTGGTSTGGTSTGGTSTGGTSTGGTSTGGTSTGGTSTGGTSTGGSSGGMSSGGSSTGSSGSSGGSSTGSSGSTGGSSSGSTMGDDDAGMDPGPDMGCGPMRGADPTEASITTKGPFASMTYEMGLPDSPSYGTATVYYPTGTPGPYVSIAIAPGYTNTRANLKSWADFLSSHGYVVLAMDTNSTSDSPQLRATALTAALGTLKGENTRSGGPLNGKLATECLVMMGYSMGGGGTMIGSNTNPAGLKAAIGLSPYSTSPTSFPKVNVPTLIMVGANDPIAPPASMGSAFYRSIPATVPKMYVTFTGGAHDATNDPLGTSGPQASDKLSARYGLSWLKVNVDGDTRYEQFLVKAASGVTAFETTWK